MSVLQRLAAIPLDPVPAWAMTLSLTALWMRAGWHKLQHPARFGGTLEMYGVLPQLMLAPMTYLVPGVELALALGLVLPAAHRAAATAGALVLMAYAIAIAINLRRGRRSLDCGCLGFGREQRISSWLIVRNGLLALVSLALAGLPLAARPFGWIDVCTVSGSVVGIGLMYATFEQLAQMAARTAQSNA